jgi:tetratricopeptide (TPR) repeat protein
MPQLGQRLHSWLHVADHPSWHHQPHYSSQLAQALGYAYVQLRTSRMQTDSYLRAYAALVPFRNQLVCPEQRLNLEFALALAFAGDESIQQSLACLTAAWEIAEHLRDWAAQSEVGYLAGALLLMTSHFTDSYAVYQDALEALRRLTRDDGPADPAFELDLVLRVAGCANELGQFTSCLRYINEAYVLRALWAPDAAEEAAHLAWIDSLLARVQRQPVRALKQATAATELLLTHGSPINKGRSHTVLADSALDLLELSHAPASGRNLASLPAEGRHGVQISPTDLLTQARTAAQFAHYVAQEIHDPIGATLAQLAMRRAARLSHRQSGNGRGIAAIEKLLRKARRLEDPALLGRTEMALADELLAAGRPDAARATYWKAMRRFEEYDLGGLAFWPRRALQEWGDEKE